MGWGAVQCRPLVPRRRICHERYFECRRLYASCPAAVHTSLFQNQDCSFRPLPILTAIAVVAGAVASQLDLLDSRLRAAAAALAPTLEQAAAVQTTGFSGASAADPTDPVLLRLLASEVCSLVWTDLVGKTSNLRNGA